MQETCAVTVAT